MSKPYDPAAEILREGTSVSIPTTAPNNLAQMTSTPDLVTIPVIHAPLYQCAVCHNVLIYEPGVPRQDAAGWYIVAKHDERDWTAGIPTTAKCSHSGRKFRVPLTRQHFREMP